MIIVNKTGNNIDYGTGVLKIGETKDLEDSIAKRLTNLYKGQVIDYYETKEGKLIRSAEKAAAKK
jgi:hypothetical protein